VDHVTYLGRGMSLYLGSSKKEMMLCHQLHIIALKLPFIIILNLLLIANKSLCLFKVTILVRFLITRVSL